MSKTKTIKIENTKMARCKHCYPSMGKFSNENYCVKNGWEEPDAVIVTEEICEKCECFESRFIEYPLTINGIENQKIRVDGIGHSCGCLCEIRPCMEEYKGRSFVGIYIGDIPISIFTSYDKKTGILSNSTMNNPAIFVPELKKIVYGCESWWRKIKSIDDFKGISESDIENTWYVKLLRQMDEKQ